MAFPGERLDPPVHLAGGWLTDRFFTRQERFLEREDHELDLHGEEVCHCFSRTALLPQLREIAFQRALLVALFAGFLFLLATGLLGPAGWDWKKTTFAVGAGFALFVVLTVLEHFLEQHLWEHVLKKHLLRIFLWTFASCWRCTIWTPLSTPGRGFWTTSSWC